MLRTIHRLLGGSAKRARHGTVDALVAGLGNPGSQYTTNRHNVGFMVLDTYAKRGDFGAFRKKFQGHFLKTAAADREIILLKPHTFMNRSGDAVQEALHFYNLPIGKLIVIHDELDLEFGVIRIKVGGGTAGHKGLKSITERCGGNEFIRLRIGIGRPRSERAENYVLSDFSKSEQKSLPEVLDTAADALSHILSDGAQSAMSRYNIRTPSPDGTSAS
jgi:PTH1 family peptidyl-tRNA hydrolase